MSDICFSIRAVDLCSIKVSSRPQACQTNDRLHFYIDRANISMPIIFSELVKKYSCRRFYHNRFIRIRHGIDICIKRRKELRQVLKNTITVTFRHGAASNSKKMILFVQ